MTPEGAARLDAAGLLEGRALERIAEALERLSPPPAPAPDFA